MSWTMHWVKKEGGGVVGGGVLLCVGRVFFIKKKQHNTKLMLTNFNALSQGFAESSMGNMPVSTPTASALISLADRFDIVGY